MRDLRSGPLLAVCAALLTATTGMSGCAPGTGGSGQAPGTASQAPADAGLSRLVDLAAQRLATADTVAEAKWASGGSISDPAREKVVLDAAAAAGPQRGLDAGDVAQVFRDQIEANKAVQYGLFSDWSADPGRVPAAVPDLTKVRPVLDGITGQLLDALAAARVARAEPGCRVQLDRATDDAERNQHLDDLHRRGLDRALRSICG
jgi:chorismate mutase